MEKNKAVKMLKAAEEGGYGVVGIVSVNPPLSTPIILRAPNKNLTHRTVQPRNNSRRRQSSRSQEIPRPDPPLPMGTPLLPAPNPPRRRGLL